MEDLKNFNIHDLMRLINKPDEEFMLWLQKRKLLWTTRYCECGKEFSQQMNRSVNKETNMVTEQKWPVWRCYSKKNHNGGKPAKGYFDGTFFAEAHLSPKQIIEFSYYWCRKTHSQMEFEHDMGIGGPTIVDWKQFCRDVSAAYFVNHPKQIGGEGIIVEIDETVLCRPKYHRGRELSREQQWFFGGVERGNSKGAFMVPVDKRDASTLLPILQKFVLPGSVIVSDCWKAYGGIENLPEGYRHYTVNHSVEFVNKETGQHTNSIESQWQKFKQAHKQRYGTHRGVLNSYMEEFLWRKEFDGPDVFFHFWSQVAEIYQIDT